MSNDFSMLLYTDLSILLYYEYSMILYYEFASLIYYDFFLEFPNMASIYEGLLMGDPVLIS